MDDGFTKFPSNVESSLMEDVFEAMARSELGVWGK